MVKKLWHKWIARTRKRALERANLDNVLYGVGYLESCWWGWRRISPHRVIVTRRSFVTHAEQAKGERLLEKLGWSSSEVMWSPIRVRNH